MDINRRNQRSVARARKYQSCLIPERKTRTPLASKLGILNGAAVVAKMLMPPSGWLITNRTRLCTNLIVT